MQARNPGARMLVHCQSRTTGRPALSFAAKLPDLFPDLLKATNS